jgi:hypothetical protein
MIFQTNTVAGIVLLLFFCLAGVSFAGEAGPRTTYPVQSNRVVTTSASGRFVVTGPDAVSNIAWTRWAEETTGQLEHFLGVKFPFRRMEAIDIRLVSGREAASIPAFLSRVDSGLFQRMITLNATAPLDFEAVDELLCRALVTGYIRDRYRGKEGGGVPSVPEWLTMGVVQNLRPVIRTRNRNVIMAWRTDQDFPRLTAMLQWQTLPEGWPRYRSLCGMAFNWLGTFNETIQSNQPIEKKVQPTANSTDPYVRILDRLANDGAVTAVWLAGEFTRTGSEEDMEKAWREWVGRQAHLIQSFGEVSSVLIEQLRDELPLEVPSGEAGGQAIGLAPRDAIERRGAPGVSLAAMEKVQRLRALTLGKAEELTRLGEAYARFYERLSVGAWPMTLYHELNKAEKAMDQLADLTRRREAYLDAVEREWPQRLAGWKEVSDVLEPVLDKGRLERYVDEAEKKYLQAQKETSRDLGHDNKDNDSQDNSGNH